ncbi:hypothetical protein C8J57DRAFT_1254932 [Mycena rebaudengoi]|nr:hypothetical protein C8J57DRAFT_1254932 [Mycena rebaudengoi]
MSDNDFTPETPAPRTKPLAKESSTAFVGPSAVPVRIQRKFRGETHVIKGWGKKSLRRRTYGWIIPSLQGGVPNSFVLAGALVYTFSSARGSKRKREDTEDIGATSGETFENDEVESSLRPAKRTREDILPRSVVRLYKSDPGISRWGEKLTREDIFPTSAVRSDHHDFGRSVFHVMPLVVRETRKDVPFTSRQCLFGSLSSIATGNAGDEIAVESKETEEDVTSELAGQEKRRLKRLEEEEARRKMMSTTGDVKPHEFQCGQCGERVPLEKRGKYYTSRWREHMKKCRRKGKGKQTVWKEEKDEYDNENENERHNKEKDEDERKDDADEREKEEP